MSSPSRPAAESPTLAETAPSAPIVLDVYFDFACPWCYIGRHRMQRALESRPHAAVRLRWQPYQLNPGMPRGGIDRRSYLIAKFGALERVAHILRLIRLSADNESIPIDLDRIPRTPNTLDAHRLTHFLTGRGQPPEILIDRIFAAFMVEGRDIGDICVLTELAEELGHRPDMVREYLVSGADSGLIENRDHAARRMGVQAVPCFVFNGRYALSGAQGAAAFLPFIDHPEIYDGEIITAEEISGS